MSHILFLNLEIIFNVFGMLHTFQSLLSAKCPSCFIFQTSFKILCLFQVFTTSGKRIVMVGDGVVWGEALPYLPLKRAFSRRRPAGVGGTDICKAFSSAVADGVSSRRCRALR